MDFNPSRVWRAGRRNGGIMIPAADNEARHRFAHELKTNFSVIAAAGSGKTRAISNRIVEIARSEPQWLADLVVVTYTNRAADEMQQRTRQQILEERLSLEVVDSFNRAFFGTIHSFCVKLLTSYGYHLGLPANLELITDDEDLWNQFVQQHTTIGHSLSEKNRRIVLRHVRVRHLMELARRSQSDLSATEPCAECPAADFERVYNFARRAATNIPKAQEELRRWEKGWRETDDFAPWPPCATTSKEFVQQWREAFQPMREWVNACALCAAAEVQRDYRQFRMDRGFVTYSDQVTFAAQLLQLPDVAERIRQKNYRVILDEAQDTDAQQFFILLEMAKPARSAVDAQGDKARLRPGHFCMVGDFQQAIYRHAGELAHYRELHRALVGEGSVEELKFSATFRLDSAQLEFVNATFGNILNNTEGQVEFVELHPRPAILPGQVIRLDLGAENVDLALPEARRASMEAAELAHWIATTGLEQLRARSWSQVAVLCPRKAWLRSVRDALLEVDIPVEVQSETEREAEHPAYAWLTALTTVMVDPHASYEIVGVLREVFGISDDELARFAQATGTKFQIGDRTPGRGLVQDTLNMLVRLRDALTRQPLFTAMREIVRVTQLAERLRSLPPSEFGNAEHELARLLSLSAAHEVRRGTLSEFAEALRRNFSAVRETHPSSRDAIQLITAHKAKGSEWDAVIVPFLAREVRIGATAYPRVVDRNPPQIAFDRNDLLEVENEVKTTQRHEMERLLYVALTRAKHSLVLAVDSRLFRGARGQVHTDTQLKWMQGDEGQLNAAALSSLSGEAQACARSSLQQAEVKPAANTLRDLQLETGWFDLARSRAGDFIETMVPSKFSPEEKLPDSDEVWLEVEPELHPPRTDNPATRYGLWWHDFTQRIPWRGESVDRDKIFQVCVVDSPEAARSRREWQLLQRQLDSSTELARRLQGAVSIQIEMPFFWALDPSKSLEGIIDLVLFEQPDGKCFILDWKTNRIPHERQELELLRARYRPQLAAYSQAVARLSGQTVEAAIYSTATGELLIYAQDEIAAEWNRLNALPKDEFEMLVAR